ncbi:hypothetical protein [Chitinophaga sp. sic0106]|uniref:hypothetical protein n=1 Tax=Chitinophaga sp. sic0106 TaxID=2854785 RepID=UPI001C49323D|nr:hypothetical protein [Chitinophaga sp. sic0106]MBV7531327.1 hypothetical protein [Chitinophaga sp. sic0106]
MANNPLSKIVKKCQKLGIEHWSSPEAVVISDKRLPVMVAALNSEKQIVVISQSSAGVHDYNALAVELKRFAKTK